MPYIKQERRVELLMGNQFPRNTGELNFLFSFFCKEYWKQQDKHNYQGINDIVGALEGAKAEFQRQVVAPYENTKIEENGPLY